METSFGPRIKKSRDPFGIRHHYVCDLGEVSSTEHSISYVIKLDKQLAHRVAM